MKTLALFACLLLASCGALTQQSRQETVKDQGASTGASTAAVDFVSHTKTKPQPPVVIAPQPVTGPVTVSGRDNTVTFATSQPAESRPVYAGPAAGNWTQHGGEIQDTEDIEAGLNTSNKGSTSNSFYSNGKISVSLTIIGWAVGIGLLAVVLFGIIMALRKGAFGAGAQAAFETSDAAAAKLVHTLEAQAIAATDPTAKAAALAALAQAQQARGTNAANTPAPPTP